jgi:hypothetical protein
MIFVVVKFDISGYILSSLLRAAIMGILNKLFCFVIPSLHKHIKSAFPWHGNALSPTGHIRLFSGAG